METNKSKKKIIHIAAFLIPLITVFVGMILGNFAPFGGKDVLTAGGMSEYIPYFSELYDKVHNGESLVYSLKSGLGYDFTTVWTYYLSDPLNLIVLLFPKSAMLSLFNLLYMIKIGLAGLFFSLFLSYRYKKVEKDKNAMALARADEISAYEKKRFEKKKKEEKKSGSHKKDFKIGGHEAPNTRFGMFISQLDVTNLAFSTAYALSFYMLGQGLNITRLSSIALFPLILLGLDMLIQERKWKLYTLTYLISYYMSFHITVIISVFLFFYFILQDYRDFKHFVRSFGFKLFGDVLAVGGSMIIILNCLNSSFFHDNFSIKFPYGGNLIPVFDVFKMQMTGISPSPVWEYTNGIDIYCGAAAIFLLFLFLFNKNINFTSKVKKITLLLLPFLGLFMVTPNHLLNGFFYTNGNLSIFAFIFISILLTIGYEAFLNIKYSKSAHITFAALLSAAIVITAIIFSKMYGSMSPYLTTLEMLFLFFILVLIWKNDSMTELIFSVSFAVIMIAEICSAYANQLSIVGKSAELYTDTIDYKLDAAENYIHSKEKDARILIYDPDTSNSTPLTNTLLGYQYIITSEDTEMVDSLLEYQETYQGIAIYTNPYVVKNGFYIGTEVSDWEYNKNYPYTSFNILTQEILKSEKIFHILDGEFNLSDGYIFDSYGNLDDTLSSYNFNFVVPTAGDIYSNFTHLVHIGFAETDETVSFTETISIRDAQNVTFATQFVAFDEEAFLGLYNSLIKNEGLQNTVQIQVSDAGFVLLPIFGNDNWKINGNYTGLPITIGSDTCLLVPVSEDDETLSLSYQPRFIYIGLSITVLFIAILVLLCALSHQRKLDSVYELFRNHKLIGRITQFISSNYTYFALILLSTGIFIIMLMYQSCAPFGSNSAIISDGYVQTYPIFSQFYNNLRHGDISLLNYSLSFGMDNYLLNFSSLLSPINWLYLLFPELLSLTAFTFIFMVKFVLTGAAMIFYLTHRPNAKKMNKRDIRLIPIALSYNLSAFCISFISYGFFIDMALMVPFVLLAMENLVYEKKTLPYIFIMIWMMMVGNYYTFLLCEFLVLYFFILEHKNIKNFFMNGIRFALSSIIAAGVSAISLVPFYLFTRQSSYQTDDIFPQFSLANTLIQSFQDLQIGHGAITISKDFTRANTYCGILILLFIPIYLLNKNINLSKRIRTILLLLLLYFSYGNYFMNFVLHGFHFQSSVPNRFSIFFMFVLITMFYDCILTYKDSYTKQTVLGFTLFSICIIGITIYNNFSAISFSAIVTIIFLVLYLAVFIGAYLRKKRINSFILSLLVIELLINSFVCFSTSIGAMTAIANNDNSRIEKLAEKHHVNNDLARSVFKTNTMYNNSALLNLNSPDAFSSMMTSAQHNLLNTWNTYHDVNAISYGVGNPLANMMLNIQYNFTSQYYDSASVMKRTDYVGNIIMYENETPLSLGIVLDPSIVDWQSDAADILNCFEYQNSFSQTLIQKDIYETIILEKDENKVTEQTSYCLIDMNAFRDEESDTVPARVFISSDVSGDIYMDYHSFMFYIGTATEGEQNEFYIDLPKIDALQDSYTLSIARFNEENFNELYNELKPYIMNNIATSFNGVSGDITADADGILYISLPNYQSAWTAYVDGNEVSIQPFLGGIGIPVEPGTHHVELKYFTYGLKTGALVSLISLLIFCGYIFVYLKSQKKVNESEDA